MNVTETRWARVGLRRMCAAGAMGALVALAGCARSPLVPPATPVAPRLTAPSAPAGMLAVRPETGPAFRFSPGDEVDLRVPDAPQFDQTAHVRPDGRVTFPIIGAVRLQGRTPEDVQAELADRLDNLAGDAAQRDYLLHPNDDIDIKFPYQASLNDSVRVRPDGKIQLQMVGAVQAEGRSPEELQKDLTKRYARFLRNPHLAVMVRSFNSQSVRTAGGGGRGGLRGLKPLLMVRNFQPQQIFVGGEVARPGTLPYRPGLSLMQAMIEAGGQLPTGELTELVILRRGADDAVELLQAGVDKGVMRAPRLDVPLRPFDVVILPKTGVATLADNLNQYVFNLVPFLRNSSIGAVYNIRGYQP